MPIYQLKLLERLERSPGLMEFRFEKPPTFTFIPGQYGGFTLIDPDETDAGGITRRFTLLSTPQDPYLAIATRIQASAYKRVLNTLDIGQSIKFAGPTGNFILHEDVNTPAVFLAGGIGITPFHSMICDLHQRNQSRPITLFYGMRSIEDVAYLDELQQWLTHMSQGKLIATIATPNAAWKSETGFITDDMIHRHVKDLDTSVYYACGSPAMVNAMRNALSDLNIPIDRIKVEDFPGY